MPSSISANRNSVNRNHMPMKTSFYRFAALLLFAAALSAGCGERTDDMRLLYWNIQNGMWSDQSNGYDNFVAWVKGYDPDVCVWCEAQSIYKSGTAERMDSVDRYLTYRSTGANWRPVTVINTGMWAATATISRRSLRRSIRSRTCSGSSAKLPTASFRTARAGPGS